MADRAELATEHARLDAEIKAAEASDDEGEVPDDDTLSPAEIKKLKSARTKTKKARKAIDTSLLAAARQALDSMPESEAPGKAIGVLRNRMEKLVADHFATIERSTLAWYDNLAHKYGTTLRDLEAERDAAAARLEKHLKELGYG